jgi:peptide/nickel transport system substrate-binding protein
MGGMLTLILSKTAFSQTDKKKYAQDLIVGELLGKVDPNDLWELIQSNYYPVLRNNSETELIKVGSSGQEIIYKLVYPDNNLSNHPNRIIFRFFESENSLIAAIITDEVDFAITESYAAAEEIDKSTSSFRIHFRYKNPNHVKMLAYNNQHYILRNPNIRKALTHAINRSDILERILGRAAYLADGPLSHESKLHISGLDDYKFNPKRAIQILENEYWNDSDRDGVVDKNGQPFRISLIYEKGVLLEEQLATRIKIDWNRIGVDVIRKPLVKSEIKKKLVQRNYDVILINHIFEETIESFEEFFRSTSNKNFLGYKNRTVDRYIHYYRMQEPSSQKSMLQAIQKQINGDHPAAFLFFLWVDRYFVNRRKFANFQEKGQLLPFTEWILRN